VSRVRASAANLDQAQLGVTVTSVWTQGADVTVEATYPYSISLLGMVVNSGNLTSRSTERVGGSSRSPPARERRRDARRSTRASRLQSHSERAGEPMQPERTAVEARLSQYASLGLLSPREIAAALSRAWLRRWAAL